MKEDMFPNANINKIRWNHMPLTYGYIDKNYCGIGRVNKLNSAFDEISKETNGSVYFVEGNPPDILINCSYSEANVIWSSDYYYTQTLGEGGPNYMWGNIILNATLDFYPTGDACGYFPFVEIHEILHTLGYEQNLYGQWHYPNMNYICTIMGNYTTCQDYYNNEATCGTPHIDNEIISDLEDIYNKKI